MIATGRPTSSCTARTSRRASACCSCVPCEKLSRAQSIPACTRVVICSRVDDAGPSVAMIFVRRAGAAAISIEKVAPA